MYPTLQYKLTGLEPNVRYNLSVEMVLTRSGPLKYREGIWRQLEDCRYVNQSGTARHS